jgi:hypothetical protein
MTTCVSAVLLGVVVGMIGAAAIIAVTLWAAAAVSGVLAEESELLQEQPEDKERL